MLAKIKEFVKPSREISTRFAIRSFLLENLSKFFYWVKKYQADIILVIGVILISLLSFALGYIVAKQEEKEPLQFEMTND